MPKIAKICDEVGVASRRTRRSGHHAAATTQVPAPQSARVLPLRPSPEQSSPKKSDALAPLLEALEVEIIGLTAYRGPNQTAAAATLRDILAAHGEEHFVLLLRTITESKGNAQALINPVLYAVSDVMLAFPKWPAQGLAWIEAFDGIRLMDLMLLARKLKAHVKARAAIAGMLARMLEPIFSPPKPPRPPKPERVEKPSGALRAVEQGKALLKHKGPHANSRISRLGFEKFGLPADEVADCMNAARLYGDRPELVAPLSRNALFELSAPATPPRVREYVEEMLAGGEKVGARAIIAMRKGIGQA